MDGLQELLQDPEVKLALAGALAVVGASVMSLLYVAISRYVRQTPTKFDDAVWGVAKRLWPKRWRPKE